MQNVKKMWVDSDASQISVDAYDQSKIYEIGDHTLEVLMHPSVLELRAVRVIWTPHNQVIHSGHHMAMSGNCT